MATDLSSLFGNSPFQGLSRHSSKVQQCVGLIRDLFDASLAGNHDGVVKLADDIFRLETEADQLRDAFHENLTSRLLLSVSKTQLFAIIEHQDSIADRAEDLAAIFTYRPLTLPEDLKGDVSTFFDESLANCQFAESIFSKLILLVESSFRGRDAEAISEMIFELRKKEDVTKGRKIDLLRKLHQSQASFDPLDLMYWTQVVEIMGDISKFADNAAAGISSIIRGA